MKEHRLPPDAVDEDEPWLHHRQAISHAVAHKRGCGKDSTRLPTQLVFPDKTSCIGAAVSRGIFPLSTPDEAEPQRNYEDQQQRIQNEPVVVYTTLSTPAVTRPILVRKCGIWLVLAGAQSVCMFLVLAGERISDFELGEARLQRQQMVYGMQLNLHVLFLLAFIFDATFLLKVYGIGMHVLLVLALLCITNGLDILTVLLSFGIVHYSEQTRNLCLPHCFVIRQSNHT